jgi:hypothetical protein
MATGAFSRRDVNRLPLLELGEGRSSRTAPETPNSRGDRNRDAAQWRRDVVLLLAERLKSRRAKGEPVLFFLLDLAFVTRA